VEDLSVANDVPFCEHRESALRESGCLDIEFLVRFEIYTRTRIRYRDCSLIALKKSC